MSNSSNTQHLKMFSREPSNLIYRSLLLCTPVGSTPVCSTAISSVEMTSLLSMSHVASVR